MENFSYEGSCFVLNISCYSYWFVQENEKLKFVMITLYLFHGKKDKLSKLFNLHIFLVVQMVMKYRTSPWFWNLVSVRQDCERKQILLVLLLQTASLCLVTEFYSLHMCLPVWFSLFIKTWAAYHKITVGFPQSSSFSKNIGFGLEVKVQR